MSPEGTVVVENLWKRFRADRVRQNRTADLIERVGRRVRKETPPNPWTWVLKDINFRAEPGEAIGLVGVNGSGKSTLLKIINRVMSQHSGRVETSGRLGALIEVVSGISSDLTGRENTFIYGSLLGLSRKEVARRFDDIVAFAELEHAIDRKVKYYSSGMKMRIGFAVAAFLEPHILIVDEVLAVGDSSFQQKCLERMREVLQSGATLILVSHDLASVGAIASRGLWLNEGRIACDGPIEEVLTQYRRDIESHAEARSHTRGKVLLTDLRVEGPDGGLPETGAPCYLHFTAKTDQERQAALFIGVTQGAATPIFVLRDQTLLPSGATAMTIELPRLPLPAGNYFLWFGAFQTNYKFELSPWQPLGSLTVTGVSLESVPPAIVRLAPVWVESHWTRRS
jgi:ABC-type polysaccharide/polyol phosphate transport system ATPase subunit